MVSPNLENGHAPWCPAGAVQMEGRYSGCTCGWEALQDRSADRQDAADQLEQGERRAAAEARYPLELLERAVAALERLADIQGGLAAAHHNRREDD